LDNEKFAAAWNTLKEIRERYAEPDLIPEDKIPSSFDLRNIDGWDFTAGIKDQGGCGSCYTFSFLQAVESRILQYTGSPLIEPLSAQ
jgi:C1A family cysteine protease